MTLYRTFLTSVCLALALAACSQRQASAEFTATDISGADFGRDFALTDTQGKTRHLADFRGKAVVVFFGYTQCPDICPTTLTRLAQTFKLLGDEAKRVQVVFITLDPERDTPQLLTKYATSFDPSFLSLYGDSATIARTAAEYKVFYQKQPGSRPDLYSIDHSAGSYVYDPTGRLRLYVGQADTPQNIAADLRLLLAGR